MKLTSLFKTTGGQNFLVPFILVTTLFFLWGFAHSILDVLNKHFQDAFAMTKTRSALVQAMVYGSYFLMALPAGAIISKFGYRAGVLTGLLLYGIGALMFIPGSMLNSFDFFLFSLFVIGCGIACLETAANPYVTVLGPPESAARRINISQSFNGLGWIVGPLVGGMCVLDDDGVGVAAPYAVVGVIVLLVAVVFSRVKLPEIAAGGDDGNEGISNASPCRERKLFTHAHFVLGLAALFVYVAAQTGINSFFINYAVEEASVAKEAAALWLGLLGMGLFFFGRIAASVVLGRIKPDRLLLIFALGALSAMALIILCPGKIGFGAFFACFFFESIMFPTIFALSISRLGRHTKIASSLLIMCIVGGAVAPLLMGWIADNSGAMSLSFIVPFFCFAIIALYAAVYRKLLTPIPQSRA